MLKRTGIAACAALLVVSTPVLANKKKTGSQATELDPNSRGAISGIGIESRDIDAMADMVLRDLMQYEDIVAREKPARVIFDSEYFKNQSSQRIDRDMITDKLRASLNRASKGRMRFLNREAIAAVMEERELTDAGVTDVGTTGETAAIARGDYRLFARMTSLDTRDNSTGIVQRRTQVIFELFDLQDGVIVYTSEPYVILRAGGEDVVYR
jgi:penicillin-binding protein activator